MKINYIDNIPQYNKVLGLLSTFKELACDIETYIPLEYKGVYGDKALNSHHSKISTLQLKSKDNDEVFIFDVFLLEKLNYDSTLLRDLLQSRECLVIHNASFEAKFFKKYWGVYFNNLWCTRVASQLISNALGSKFTKSASGHSLDCLVLDYLNTELKGKGTVQIEDWLARPLTKEKLDYAATDVLYLFELRKSLNKYY